MSVDPADEAGNRLRERYLTVSRVDHSHEQRRDVAVDDETLVDTLEQRGIRRVVPEIRKAFQFQGTRMERYIVASFSAQHGGHFRPHRDDTTRGAAHRRFALSVNLNEDYDGAELGFPEFGGRTYRTAAGGAVVSSDGSLLHTVRPIPSGTRYVFPPFLHGDSAAAERERSHRYLGDGVEPYCAQPTRKESPSPRATPALPATSSWPFTRDCLDRHRAAMNAPAARCG